MIITELYVPRPRLADFLKGATKLLRRSETPVIYATIRMIEQDSESFLPWARQAYACVIFNLRAVHSVGGIDQVRRVLRKLIDFALERDGSFYLTYHRFARARAD